MADWADPVLQQPYKVVDGMLHIPTRLALAWNGMKTRDFVSSRILNTDVKRLRILTPYRRPKLTP